MLSNRRRENYTRAAQGSPSDNDAIVEKLMESITSSEKYLKKVDSIDFRLNRLDIEVHEKTNVILKQLAEIGNAVRTDTCADKLDSTMHALKSDINTLKFFVEKRPSSRTGVGSLGTVYLFKYNKVGWKHCKLSNINTNR